jgi:trimethylamine--corrinoid protein Co-methyltransferase
MEILSGDRIRDLHDTSIRVLKELGVKVMGGDIRALFASARVFVDDAILRIDETIVISALTTVPREFTLTPRVLPAQTMQEVDQLHQTFRLGHVVK